MEWASCKRDGPLALVSFYDIENNAVRQLAAGCRMRGFRVLEIYFKDWRNNGFQPATDHEVEQLLAILQREQVSLIGFSLRASAYQEPMRQLVRAIRARLPVPIVVGGWHATVRPEACLSFSDAVCIGEGDMSLPAFLQAFRAGQDVSRVAGFHVRIGSGEVVRNRLLPLVKDLNALPWRDYMHPDKVQVCKGRVRWGDPMRRDPLFQVMCSVGCIQRCGFCHNSFENEAIRAGPRLRFRSVGDVLDELAKARRRNPAIRRVRFDDEIFGLDMGWLEEFAERYPRECGLPFDILSEPMVVTERYADLLAKAGAKAVHLGLQYSEEVNRETLGRRGSRETTLKAINRLCQRGMDIRYLVMVDIPGVTEQQRRDFYALLRQLPRPFDVYLFSLTWFPGCSMVEDRLADGRLSPGEVEGEARKTFRQYRVDLHYPRPPEDTYWLSRMVMLSSQVLSPRLVDRLAETPLARNRPDLLRLAATAANLVKTGRVALAMTRRGELTPSLVRRWLNPSTMITM